MQTDGFAQDLPGQSEARTDETPILTECRGVIEAPVETVSKLLLGVRAGRFNEREIPFILLADGHSGGAYVRGGPRKFSVLLDHGPASFRLHIEVDWEKMSLRLRGNWLYWGVYEISVHENGSLITYRTYPIEDRSSLRWLGTSAGTQMKAALQGFAFMLRKASARLNCEAYVL